MALPWIAERSEPRPTLSADEPVVHIRAREILTAVGEVVYEWSIADDTIRWGANALTVLKVASLDGIATGRRFAALLDPGNLASRHNAVINSSATDEGGGVAFQIQYALLPAGNAEGPKLWIEDIGRWYADPSGRPRLAHGVLRVINERYEREQRLAFLSRYDELTGYFNRSHLLATLGDALIDAKRFRTSIAFLIVAVDNFSLVNDAYGYDIADQVFAAVAARVKRHLRDGDAIGRYSGNKLGLILMNCEEDDTHAAAERFLDAVHGEVVTIAASSVAVTASIGGVLLPRHDRTINEAMAHAEEALHIARQRGQRHFVAYSHSESRDSRRRHNMAISRELVTALREKRFKLAIQPVVDIATRRPVFHEALLRLVRKDGEVVVAADFIGTAESLGLIGRLDHHVLDLTLEALAAAPGVTMAVNVSAQSIEAGEWLSRLAAGLAAGPGVAGRLIVEITETGVVRNLAEASHFVATIHDLGGRVAIDDFGAGYTSFRNLRVLDVDIVKIDGAFIEHLADSADDQAFVRALVDLARNFGIRTVAERVQDEATVALLAGWGVDWIQGDLTGLAKLDRPQGEFAAAD